MSKRVPEVEAKAAATALKPDSGIAAKASGVAKPGTGRLIRLCVAAWLVPGAGHFMLGRRGRAVILFLAIILMFAIWPADEGPVLLHPIGLPGSKRWVTTASFAWARPCSWLVSSGTRAAIPSS